MKIILAAVIFALYTLQAQGQNKFATCDRAWKKIGCFKDNIKPSRPLPEMLLNDRDRKSKYHQPGYRLNWHRWKESIHSLACRCAQKALAKGYTVFGLQFYGECWSGPSAELNFNRDGVASPKKCIMNLEAPTECDASSNQECVGTSKTNYIYKLMENPGPQTPDVDGNYTNWSQWTECSKTCGGGEKTRERTCTSPAPQGNGKNCEGEPEESVPCNEQKCDDCDKVMDLGVVVDSSSSVTSKNFEYAKIFLKDLVDKMHVSDRMTHLGVIHYNHNAYLDWDFNSDAAKNIAATKRAINNLKYKPGRTRTDRAMDLAMSALFNNRRDERQNVPDVLLVITDGKTSKRSKKYSEVLKPYKENNIEVIAVGVGRRVDKTELLQIADSKKENVFQVSEFKELAEKIKEIVRILCAFRRLVKQ